MFRTLSVAAAATALALSAPVAEASLPVGARAPQIVTVASLAGKPFRFNLAQALRRGPVVLYFFPAAFTKGCTVEAHEFAEATDEFRALGATVIGISADDIATLNRFSVSECRNKFAVASASPAVIKAYDVQLPASAKSNRTSFVIAPDGRILYAYSALSPAGHVKNSLDAVRAWRARRG